MIDIKCDLCNRPFDGPIVGVFMRRPSDRNSMCAVMWECPECATAQDWTNEPLRSGWRGGLATYEQALSWVEEFGSKLDPFYAVLFID